jgi:hypothetical protein
MPRKKATTGAADAHTAKPTPADAKAYRHTRTGAVRLSSSVLGFPYVEAEPKATPKKAEPEA